MKKKILIAILVVAALIAGGVFYYLHTTTRFQKAVLAQISTSSDRIILPAADARGAVAVLCSYQPVERLPEPYNRMKVGTLENAYDGMQIVFYYTGDSLRKEHVSRNKLDFCASNTTGYVILEPGSRMLVTKEEGRYVFTKE